MMCMPTYSKNDIVLVRYPFTDLSSSKVRLAAVISIPHISEDLFVVPLTSKITSLLPAAVRRIFFSQYSLSNIISAR